MVHNEQWPNLQTCITAEQFFYYQLAILVCYSYTLFIILPVTESIYRRSAISYINEKLLIIGNTVQDMYNINLAQ